MLKQRQRANIQHLHLGIALHCSNAALYSQQVTSIAYAARVPVCSRFGGRDPMRAMMGGPRGEWRYVCVCACLCCVGVRVGT